MANGFNAPLIAFTNGTPVDPAAMNSNFSALNLANTFTGALTTLSSDGGLLTSDGNGNLFVRGGKLGVTYAGDRIDAGTTPGTLYLTGPTAISMQISGSEGGKIEATGVAVGSGNTNIGTSAGSVNTGGGGTVAQSNNLAFAFRLGSLRFSNFFTGTGDGVFNHGLNTIPTFAFPMDSSVQATGTCVNTPTSSTITVALYDTTRLWTMWVIAY